MVRNVGADGTTLNVVGLGSFTLLNVSVSLSAGAGSPCSGCAAINMYGAMKVIISRCSIASNLVSAFYVSTPLNNRGYLTNVTMADNTAPSGSALFVDGSTWLHCSQCVLKHNSATTKGRR